ncbi:hypothetical protein QTP88_008384 [Uroleucon formosanum]
MKILGLVEDTPILSERPKGIGRCYLCGRARNKNVVKDIEEGEVLGIMCDETRCYKQEQMAFCVRYVKNLDVERFLGFIDCCINQAAESLYQYILWYLKNCKLKAWLHNTNC